MKNVETIMLDGDEPFTLFEDEQGWRVSPEDDPDVQSIPYPTKEDLLHDFHSECGPEWEE